MLFFFKKKWANPGLFLFIFRSFLVTISIIQIEKSVDGVLGIQTWGRRMVGADETTELDLPTLFALPSLHMSFSHTQISTNVFTSSSSLPHTFSPSHDPTNFLTKTFLILSHSVSLTLSHHPSNFLTQTQTFLFLSYSISLLSLFHSLVTVSSSFL